MSGRYTRRGDQVVPVQGFNDTYVEEQMVARGATVYTGVLQPGDTVYVPTGALHGAYNLGGDTAGRTPGVRQHHAGAPVAAGSAGDEETATHIGLSGSFVDDAHAEQVYEALCTDRCGTRTHTRTYSHVHTRARAHTPPSPATPPLLRSHARLTRVAGRYLVSDGDEASGTNPLVRRVACKKIKALMAGDGFPAPVSPAPPHTHLLLLARFVSRGPCPLTRAIYHRFLCSFTTPDDKLECRIKAFTFRNRNFDQFLDLIARNAEAAARQNAVPIHRNAFFRPKVEVT